MGPLTWYDLFPDRLVLETIRVKAFRGQALLKRLGTTLYWACSTTDVPDGVDAPILSYWLVYPDAFPAIPPQIEVLSPDLDPAEWGHEWHRWYNGNICYVRPSKWQASTTANEIIAKVEDWYFNYTAKKSGLIEKMPDIGRAIIPPSEINRA